MDTLTKGNYLGTTTDTLVYNNIIVSKASYQKTENQNWHCHENPFFAYFLKGGNYEYRKSKKIKCSAGTLLFYHAREPHCNKEYSNDCKIFHIEIESNWFNEYGFKIGKIKADVIDQLIFKQAFISILNEF